MSSASVSAVISFNPKNMTTCMVTYDDPFNENRMITIRDSIRENRPELITYVAELDEATFVRLRKTGQGFMRP